MKKISTLFFLLCSIILNSQNPIQERINSRLIDLHQVSNNNENFEGYEQLKKEIGEAEIVMLGEQSHGDATTFETKIKLIKFLHQEMGFDILGFESNIYECQRAWDMIQKGHNVKDALGKSIFKIWSSVEELNPLFQYFEQQLHQENPLMIAGFDNQLMEKMAMDYFVEDLVSYCSTFSNVATYQDEFLELQTFINSVRTLKRIKKKKAIESIAFLDKLIELIKGKPRDEMSDLWVQTLKGFKVFISDTKLKTNNRDQQMAENLIWLKEKYPDKKIICWGATSHFLYNSQLVEMKEEKLKKVADDYYKKYSMMGDYIKEKYGDKVYTIGFTAYKGIYGFTRAFKIDLPIENSLEFLIGKAPNDNYFLSLKDLSLEGYLSRPLAHQYMTNDISHVMDGVIFNRNMNMPYTDWDFFLYLVPENKMGTKKLNRIKDVQNNRRRNEKSNF